LQCKHTFPPFKIYAGSGRRQRRQKEPYRGIYALCINALCIYAENTPHFFKYNPLGRALSSGLSEKNKKNRKNTELPAGERPPQPADWPKRPSNRPQGGFSAMRSPLPGTVLAASFFHRECSKAKREKR